MGGQALPGLVVLITHFLWSAALQWPLHRQSGPWPTTVSLCGSVSADYATKSCNVIRSAQQVPFTDSCFYRVLTNKTEITCAQVSAAEQIRFSLFVAHSPGLNEQRRTSTMLRMRGVAHVPRACTAAVHRQTRSCSVSQPNSGCRLGLVCCLE